MSEQPAPIAEQQDTKPTPAENQLRLAQLKQELNDTHEEMADLQNQLQLLTETFQQDALKLISLVRKLPMDQSTTQNQPENNQNDAPNNGNGQ